MKIEDYYFGAMTVNEKVYDNDLIIFGDRIKSNWWRREGHTLLIEDLADVIDYKPQILVVGTGAAGMMKIAESTKETLQNNNIELIAKVTGEAYKVFNGQIQAGKKVVGAFHLTC